MKANSMLSDQDIKGLSIVLKHDIKDLNLSREQTLEQVGIYPDDIAGLECVSCDDKEILINKIVDKAYKNLRISGD